MLSVRPTTRKTYGRTASGKQITDRRTGGLDRDELERIEELTEIREDVHCIAAAHGATNVRLLGSAGRGKQDASSNLGLLVDMAEGRTLFDLIALSNELEESLGVEMDVVTETSLSPYIRDRVLAEAVALGGDQA